MDGGGGVNSLTESNPLRDEAAVRRAFPEIRKGAVKRPEGEAGLLISITESHLHSQGGRRKGRLRLFKTLLGCGQILTGMEIKRKGGGQSAELHREETPPEPCKERAFTSRPPTRSVPKKPTDKKQRPAGREPRRRSLHQEAVPTMAPL